MPGARRTLLLGGYVFAVLAPMAFLLVSRPGDGLTAAIAFAAALGFAALVVLALQLVLPARAKVFTEPFGIDVLLRFHREMGIVAAALIVVHVAVLIADDPDKLSLLNPLGAPWRAVAGVGALVALVLLLASSTIRQRLALSYEAWRFVHLTLALVVVGASVAHVLGVGRYLSLGSLRGVALLVVVAAALGAFVLRVGRPFAAAGRPYVLAAVRDERGDAVTLALRADGHDGLAFTPGQFAWLKLAHAPYALSEHPFSLSGSAEDPRHPQVTVKALGDFTARARALEPGTRVLLDGPHGAFRPALPDAGYLCVCAGIGITPAMALVRTLADRGDRRPVTLLVGNRAPRDITFREELDALRSRLPALDVVHVLSRAGDDWPGERGRLDEARLARRVPDDVASRNVLVCGSPAFADDVARALRALGVPASHLHVERFA
jgi:3-phenylpropionate/trans-cinnamate dioxygenase ferredoxin reductase subunit